MIKDAVPFVATIYYATPLPLITCAAGLWCFVAIRLTKKRVAMCAFFVATACFGWTIQNSYSVNSQQSEETDISVVLWNASSCDFGWSGIVKTMRELDPDIFALVESGSTDIEAFAHWQNAFPGYELSCIDGDMLLFSRFRIVSDEFGTLGDGGRYKHVGIDVDGRVMHIFVVDIRSDPLRSRRGTLTQLAEVVGAADDRPTLVMGDFNTPNDSIHFASLRSRFTNAFEACGDGYAPTWPIPFPVLQLDQIWANDFVQMSRCTASWTLRSDHRPVTVWMRCLP